MTSARRRRVIDPAQSTGKERYELITSLVVPRPIGWISTWSGDGVANLAPFSYFSALASSPMLVGVSVGHRAGGPKDTLVNVRARRAFCVNVVSESFLEVMNATSADVDHGVDEMAMVGIERAASERVDAPFVSDCPAVLECELSQEVSLGDAPNTLLIAQVVGVLLHEDLPFGEGSTGVSSQALRPVGRLWGGAYALPGAIRIIPRPR